MTIARQQERCGKGRRTAIGAPVAPQPRIVSINPMPAAEPAHRWLAHDAVAPAVLPGRVGDRLMQLRTLLAAKNRHSLAALLVRVSVDRFGTKAEFDLGCVIEDTPTGPRCVLTEDLEGDACVALRGVGGWSKAVSHDDVLGALFRAPYKSTAVIVILRSGVYLSPARFVEPTRGWHQIVAADTPDSTVRASGAVPPPALSWLLGEIVAYRDGQIAARARRRLGSVDHAVKSGRDGQRQAA